MITKGQFLHRFVPGNPTGCQANEIYYKVITEPQIIHVLPDSEEARKARVRRVTLLVIDDVPQEH